MILNSMRSMFLKMLSIHSIEVVFLNHMVWMANLLEAKKSKTNTETLSVCEAFTKFPRGGM